MASIYPLLTQDIKSSSCTLPDKQGLDNASETSKFSGSIEKTKLEEKSDRKITIVYLLLLNKSIPFYLNYTINKLIIFSHLIL